MDFKMRICNMTDIMEPGVGLKMVYTVEVAKGWFVDVMHVPKTGLTYIMQGEDGSAVYGRTEDDVAPDMTYCEEKAIKISSVKRMFISRTVIFHKINQNWLNK